jgi:ribonuclease HI
MKAPITVYVDGAIAGGRKTGIAAVSNTPSGFFLGWIGRQMGRMTNNEAEYEAAILGLDLARRLGAERVEIVSDSEVVVRQMQGHSRVNSARLKELHRRCCLAARHFRQVRFRHVSREENRLADALAAEALAGRPVQMPSPGPKDGQPSWSARLGLRNARPASDDGRRDRRG